MKFIKFNTFRTYTKEGQRIAAAEIDGGVYMVDIDRGIHYFLPDCALRMEDIMWRYDHANRPAYCPPSLDNNAEGITYEESKVRLDKFLRLRSDLEKFAAGGCKDDSCDAKHCPCCGGHKVDWYAPGLCDECQLREES